MKYSNDNPFTEPKKKIPDLNSAPILSSAFPDTVKRIFIPVNNAIMQ